MLDGKPLFPQCRTLICLLDSAHCDIKIAKKEGTSPVTAEEGVNVEGRGGIISAVKRKRGQRPCASTHASALTVMPECRACGECVRLVTPVPVGTGRQQDVKSSFQASEPELHLFVARVPSQYVTWRNVLSEGKPCNILR